MNNFSFKNVWKLSKFDLKINRKGIFAWSIIIFGIMFLYMILFSSMQEMVAFKMEAMPKELLQFFGMEDFSKLSDYVAYFGMIINIILIAIAIFAVTFSAKIIVNEEKFKSIEFLYSLPTSRLEIYISKLLTSILAITIVVLAAVTSTVICGYLNGGNSFVLMDILTIGKFTSFSAYFFGAIGLVIGAIMGKTSAKSIGSMVVVITYFLGYLGELLVDKAKWLELFSPINLFKAENVLNMSENTFIQLLVYFLIFIILYVIGAIVYNKRDFKL